MHLGLISIGDPDQNRATFMRSPPTQKKPGFLRRLFSFASRKKSESRSEDISATTHTSQTSSTITNPDDGESLLYGLDKVIQEGLLSLPFPNLESLEIEHSPFDAHLLAKFLHSVGPRLKNLSIGSAVSLADLEVIVHAVPTLETLSLFNVNVKNEDTALLFALLRSLKNLRSLSISSSVFGFKGYESDSIFFSSFLTTNGAKLQEICFCPASFINSKALDAIIEKCPNLIRLSLDYSSMKKGFISVEDLVGLLKSMKQLEELNLVVPFDAEKKKLIFMEAMERGIALNCELSQ